MKKMSMRMKVLLAAVCLLGAGAAVQAGTSIFQQPHAVNAEGAEAGVWTQDTDAGFALAKEAGLPILLNFTGSDWCYWCKLMDRRVFSSLAWRNWASQKKIVLLWVDFPQDKSMVPAAQQPKNRALSEKFGVRGYPTYYVVAPDGETVWGRLGASQDATAAEFCGSVDECIARGQGASGEE